MIHTSRTVTVGKMESVINEPIMLYRGDREVEIEFNIVGSKFMFSNGGNVIKSTNATNGQLVINTPTGENMFSEVTECNDGKVICVITKEMIDELTEVGFYSFQIRLFDESQVSRVTIPPVYQGIEIRNPIAAEDETDLVDIGLVDYSVVRKNDYENVVTFLPNGDYNKTNWEEHDVISKDRLNKVEDALYEINKGTEALYPTLQNQYDEFSAKVNKDVKAHKEEMEDEVEQFERDMTQQWGEFKVDYKDEVHDKLDDLYKTKLNKKEVLIHFIQLDNFGESILIQTPDSNIMIDFGQEADKTLIEKYLKRYSVETIDYIIISHHHSDHIGGLSYILEQFNTDNCVAYLPTEPDFNRFNNNGTAFKEATNKVNRILTDNNITIIHPTENQSIDIDGVLLRFNNCNLDIFEKYYNTTHEYASVDGETDYNNFSLVTTLIFENTKVLFTGDINIAAQTALLDIFEKCDVLKTEHHSVNTETYLPYLEKVNPNYIVSCNVSQSSIYKSTTSRYFDGKEYYVTFYSGDIVISSNGEKIAPITNNKRFEINAVAGRMNVYGDFYKILPTYDPTKTTLYEIIENMHPHSRMNGWVMYDTAPCPTFISKWNGVIDIYKASDSTATIKLKDSNPNLIGIYEGLWRKEESDIKWWEIKNKDENEDENEIKIYKDFAAFGLDDTVDALTVVKAMPQKTNYSGYVSKSFASYLLSSWNGIATIEKVTNNSARIFLTDANPDLGANWIGIYHSSINDITWYKMSFSY